MSLSNPPKNPPQYSISSILGDFESKIVSDVSDALRGRPGARTFGVDDKPKEIAEQAINQLIYSQVLELIDTGTFIDHTKTRQELIDAFRQQLRAKAKAKYIGRSDE